MSAEHIEEIIQKRNMRRQKRLWRAGGITVLVAGIILLSFCLLSMAQEERTLKRFRVPEYDDDGVKKSELTGENAALKADGTADITDLKIDFYEPDGTVKMKVTAPHCKYSQKRKLAKSPSSVRIESGRMVVTGDNFAWDGARELFKIFTNSVVVIQGDGNSLGNKTKIHEPNNGNSDEDETLENPMMNKNLMAAGAMTAMIVSLPGGLAPTGHAAEAELEEGVTVITSERLTFDYLKNYAVFERDVVVVDPSMRLTTDRLAVWFDEEGEIKLIKAEGNVEITQDDKLAQAGEATYDVPAGKILLEKSPRLQRGLHHLKGTTITYWRNDEKLVVEPNSVLTIYPGSGDKDLNVFGD
jgi:lipopolysaccharide transport protein LptA